MVAKGPESDKVIACVLDPMTALFKAQNHLRTEQQLEAAFEQYVSALKAYSEATLTEAYERVRAQHRYSTWPSVADFETMCNLIEVREKPAAGGRSSGWIAAAEKRLEEFMWAYEKSPLGREALADGWYHTGLRLYVEKVARRQAQALERNPHSSGEISVDVPQREIVSWKAWAANQSAHRIHFGRAGNVIEVEESPYAAKSTDGGLQRVSPNYVERPPAPRIEDQEPAEATA